ncbi:MAG: DUF169 domain-containing protein [Oscillospiraceae bacterium]|nr:DUF169 domain-containing protein [Oscillospiraceae bacterium]
MLENNKKYHDLLVKLVGLRYPGVAFKLIKDESEVPEGAVRPMKDWGYHIAVCQAFAYARRQGKTIYMEKEDHWCWNPIIVYGMIDNETAKKGFRAMHKQLGTSMESADAFVDSFPCIPYGEYRGVLVAPLDKADFKPDVTLIYCKNYQLRVLLMAIDSQIHSMVESSFTPLDSCTYSVVPAILEGKYRITLPDPGEYERGMTPEDDIILSVPAQREEEFYKGVEYQTTHGTVNSFYPTMKEEFSRPPFYNTIFEAWGLMTGPEWDKTKKLF